MSSDRAATLEATIKERLLDAQRHLKTLEHSAAEFGEDFDSGAFEEAWRSNEPAQLAKAHAVQAGYENVINACIKVAQELCQLEGWGQPGVEASSVGALKLLHENGVIIPKTREALKEAQERRSDVQHDYVNVAAREIHIASLQVMEFAPIFVQDVASHLRGRS